MDPKPSTKTAPTEGMNRLRAERSGWDPDKHYPEEAPVHKVRCGLDRIRHTVTSREFQRFVEATGHVTLAEKPANAAGLSRRQARAAGAPASVMFRKTAGRSTCATPTTGGRTWPAPTGGIRAGPDSSLEGLLRSSGRARRVRGRRGVRATWAGQGAADRGRSGSSRRAAGSRAPSTSGATSSCRAASRWRTPGRASSRGRTCSRTAYEWTAAGRLVPGQRLRPLRHGRQRLGVDHRLVPEPRRRSSMACCTLDNPRGGEARAELRPAHAERPDPAQGHEGRLVPVRAELLPPLSPGRAHGAADRHLDVPPRDSAAWCVENGTE